MTTPSEGTPRKRPWSSATHDTDRPSRPFAREGETGKPGGAGKGRTEAREEELDDGDGDYVADGLTGVHAGEGDAADLREPRGSEAGERAAAPAAAPAAPAAAAPPPAAAAVPPPSGPTLPAAAPPPPPARGADACASAGSKRHTCSASLNTAPPLFPGLIAASICTVISGGSPAPSIV